jgi:predicted permease
MTDLAHDLRYAARMLRKSPGFAGIAVLMLALGIGANTAIFSLVSTAFLRPLPFPDPARLVAIWEDTPLFGLKYSPPALGNYSEWKTSNQVFENMGALESWPFRLSGEREAEEVYGSIVTASLFDTLGVKPFLGRSFLPEEDYPGPSKTVILSYGLWRRRFAADPAIVGQPVLVNSEKHLVAGVMPQGFRFPDMQELWVPMGAFFPREEFSNRGRHNLMVVARLKPGVTLPRANDNLRAIAARLAREYPRTNANVGAFASSLREHSTGSLRTQYAILLGAVGFVLLIACANLANLLLARAAGRQREIAIRAALGAGRLQIARQLFAEGLLLSGVGAALGLLLALWSFRFLAKLLPGEVAATTPLAIDRLALAFTAGLAVLTTLIFGAAPVVQALRADLNEALKQGGGRSGAAGRAGGLRGALVVGEVALSLLLLVGAGLMIRSFSRLRGVDPGFPSRNLLTMRVAPSLQRYPEPPQRVAFYREVLRRVQALPGVASAGFSIGVPVAFKGWYNGVLPEGSAEAAGGEMPTANYRVVTSDYLQTLGVPLRRGRYLEERDGPAAPLVAVINESFARRFWPAQDPIGKRFKQGGWGPESPWFTVVGVVGDIKTSGLDAPSRPEMYLSYQQQPAAPSGLVIRTRVPPDSLSAAVRREVRALDAEQPLSDVMTMDEVLDNEVSHRRLQSVLLGAFSALALLLASFGLYGVLSYTVARRTREIGIRLALGARPGAILSGVIRQAVLLAAAGLAIGVAAALALSRALGSLLYGVSPRDPWTIGGAALLMLAISAVAGAVPARRAMRVDPIVALREE